MILGPIFSREATTVPRRPQHYLFRSIYVATLLLLTCTCWLVVAGTQIIVNVGDMARFGATLFRILAPLQLTLILFFAAMNAVSAVAQEKDRRTLILLLMTRLRNTELVLGKLGASLLNILSMLLAGLPVFMALTLLGGASFRQVGLVFAVTLLSALAAGSLGATLAFWREKTFQTIAMTALALVIWIGVWEAVNAGLLGASPGGIAAESWATSMSPLRAVLSASRPVVAGSYSPAVLGFLIFAGLTVVFCNALAIWRVRIWNPSRELRRDQADEPREAATVFSASAATVETAEVAREAHVDSRQRRPRSKSRDVWDNPVLWREVCTWAYGRKVLIIRLAYLLFFAMAATALYASVASGSALHQGDDLGTVIPPAARSLAPLLLVSLVIVNALAVNAITNERDGQALDLLLVTDISPQEFVSGKLAGVLWVTKEMILLPLALCLYLWWQGGLSGENLLFLLVGLIVMYIFATTLGIHCGMIYSSSRTAMGVSLGTVFFLFLGVVTCMLIMVSFSGSFQTQLAPFLALIVGGGVGLYVSLGARNPSAAIGAASILLPFATFFAITSFLLGKPFSVFAVVTMMYGFTTAAMLIPALYNFDFAMGRTKTGDAD